MIGVRLNMKNYQKITVIASTVLLSSVFSPTAHADEEQYFIQPTDLKEVYTYESAGNEVDALDQENQGEDLDLKEEENQVSSQDIQEVQTFSAQTDTSEAENLDLEFSETYEYTPVGKSNEEVKLAPRVSPASLDDRSSTESFDHTDVYTYKSVDLDKEFIAKDSSQASSPTHHELREVDKSADGRYVLKSDGEKSYYYDNGVLMKGKDTVLNGKFYNLDSQGVARVATNKWVNVNGVKYYANQYGYTQIGLKKIGNTTYHFEQNGKLSSNKNIYANGTYYKINNQGIASTIRSQWLTYNGNTFYVNNKGGKAQGLTQVSGKTYYFNNSGMATNIPVLYTGDRFYKVDGKGVVTPHRNTWVTYNGKEFYANENGWRSQGVTHIGGQVYNLTKSGKGKNYYAYSKKDNATYYFDSNGVGSVVSWGKPSKDLDLLLGWMYDGMNNNMTYSMSNLRTSPQASDCSSAVYRSMIYSGFLPEGSFIGNTETLFKLGAKGEVLKQIKEEEIRYGDIFVAGVPGQSLGAGGHTGFILDKNTIVHSNYSDNGISQTPRKGRMGDAGGLPVRYYRLVGGTSRKLYL